MSGIQAWSTDGGVKGNAMMELHSTCRSFGFGVGPTCSAVDAMADVLIHNPEPAIPFFLIKKRIRGLSNSH